VPRVGTPAPEVQRLGYTAQCLRDSGAGYTSLVVPRAAARRSQVVPHSKQLGSQTRRCRAERAAGQVARRGDAKTAEEVRGPASGRAQEGPRTSPEVRSTGFHPTGSRRLRFLQGGSEILLQEHEG
jgi:hypothetical protein